MDNWHHSTTYGPQEGLSDNRIALRAYCLAELRHYYLGEPKPERPDWLVSRLRHVALERSVRDDL